MQYLHPRQYQVAHLEKKIPVAILGATGMVGRRFGELLSDHPYFQIVALSASVSSNGKNYGELMNSRGFSVPEDLAKKTIQNLECISRDQVRLIFSAFDGTKEEIRNTESLLADKGFLVVSNNSAHRGTPDVPMMLPEVNIEHLTLLSEQDSYRKNGGGIVVKPNCSIQSFVPILKAWEPFRIKRIHVVTEQSISGAGKTFEDWPEIMDNVSPYIGGEEEKTETEPLKVLGKIRNGILEQIDLPISAICTRVASSDGHMANVFVEFESDVDEAILRNAIIDFENPLKRFGLPSSPDYFMLYRDELDRPQTRLDRDNGNGMTITVGRIQKKKNGYSFSALSHNTLRGAAGGAVLTAELMYRNGYMSD